MRDALERIRFHLAAVGAFAVKELRDFFRQPALILTLIVGPFLVLAVFGLGFRDRPEPLVTVMVFPEGSELAQRAGELQEALEPAIEVDDITTDADEARRRLAAGEVDLVVVAPSDAVETVRGGSSAEVEVIHDELDPWDRTYISIFSRASIDELNRAVLEEFARAVQGWVADNEDAIPTDAAAVDGAGLLSAAAEIQSLAPEVLVRPFVSDVSPLHVDDMSPTAFYAPGVMMVIVQHLAVTFGALSIVRERNQGIVDLFRVSPLSMGHIVLGKVLGYFLVAAAIGAATVLLIVTAFGVPMDGSWLWLAAVLVMIVLASLGLGFLIAALSNSDAQAVQFSMLTLLFTIFFSGFVISLDRLASFIRPLAYLVPSTAGVQALHDVMFRGVAPGGSLVALVAAYAVAALAGSIALLHRRLAI